MGLRDMYSAGDIIEYEGAEVVGHLGGGTVEDASRWYARRTRRYIGAECVTMDGPSPFLTVVAYGDRRGADAHPRSPCPIGVKSWRTRTTKCS